MVLPQARLRDQTGKGAPNFSFLCTPDDLVVGELPVARDNCPQSFREAVLSAFTGVHRRLIGAILSAVSNTGRISTGTPLTRPRVALISGRSTPSVSSIRFAPA
jgi:hypothetical protein